jgi:hypothetical protein
MSNIYYMSLLNKKYLFIHINKSCGGIIIQNFLQNGENLLGGYHRTLPDMLNKIKNELKINKEQLFIFTIVRNPWERMLSLYLYYYKYNYHNEFFSGYKEIDNDFNHWVEYIYSDKFDRSRIHSAVNIFIYCFCNQLNWLKENNQIISNINIYKIEDLNLEDFFTTTLNLSNINCRRVHPTKHKHYSYYYNEKSIQLVKEHYKEDIEYFGYKYERLN